MSAEAPKSSGGFSRFLGRLFGVSAVPSVCLESQPIQQPRPLNQLLDVIDHDRVLVKSVAATAYLREQQAKEKALQEAWDKAQSLETSIKNYLVIADPIITEGLSIIARRTWGDYGFTISGGFHNIINLEADKPPSLQYLFETEFDYCAQSLKYKAHPYDPYGGYYRATLKFRDGKPHSLQFGRLATTLYEKELRMIGQEDVLTRSLVEYYRQGPEVDVFVGES